MGLYNFQPQFVPFILNGTKTHTIRAKRKHMDLPGRTMHLYTGLRRKGARLLMLARCVKVEFIRIDSDYRVRIGSRIDSDNPEDIGGAGAPGGFITLDGAEKNALAWRDGFRPARTSQEQPGNAFPLMMEFWEGRLPFEGWIYHWRPLPKLSKQGKSK